MESPLNPRIEVNEHLMTITVAGIVRGGDVVRIVETHYPGFRGDRILWDLSAADLCQVEDSEFAQVATTVRQNTAPGVLRKTAYVMSSQAALLAAWRYLNEAMRVRVPVEYHAFTDVHEATRWLNAR